MPSSHSAIVCSLASCIGKEYGFDSGLFAISLIFAFVVMYDACGVRRAAGKQAKVLKIRRVERNEKKIVQFTVVCRRSNPSTRKHRR